jgi:hypothetical protein|tara:strand:- start:2656 stop:4824 length:2169 start_codon:yes stop_codon:yes gene_type:complete
MPLITSTTNLNKLKFGIGNAGDRFDNGSSNQPYIRKDIPGVDVDNSNPTPITQLDSSGNIIYGDVEPKSLDILFRGGLNAPRDAITDVSRLSKMFFDTKSPNGLIFTANQNLLSRTSVMTEASYGLGYARNKEPDFLTGKGGGALASGVYLPTSTLAQAGVGFIGTHLNLMGLDPTSPSGISGNSSGISGLFGDGPGGGLRTYSMEMSRKIQESDEVITNRLVDIFEDRQVVKSQEDNVIQYQGGPGSILGIGKTNIRFAKSNQVGNVRTGVNNALSISNPGLFNGADPTFGQKFQYTTLLDGETLAYGGEFGDDLSGKLGLSNNILLDDDIGEEVFLMNMLSATYTLGSSFEGDDGSNARGVYTNTGIDRHNSPYTVVFDATQLRSAQDETPVPGNAIIGPDFRKQLIETTGEGGEPIIKSNILSISPEYTLKNLNTRTNFGDPGTNGPKTKAGESGRLKYGVKASDMIAVDKINAQLMYTNAGVAQQVNFAKNDLVKFRIAAIDNNNPEISLFMHFRAFIDSFSDTYNAEWAGFKYSGRGEDLYHYNGFNRSINMSFTCYAQSKAELIPMYRKLNYLASTLAPDYTKAGFMRGNIVRLTLGGYLYEQAGFISSLTYEVPQESNWEIAIDEEGNSDPSVKELPFMIRVTGMSFTPIHDFLPKKISPDSANGLTPDDTVIDERYIALTNNISTNFADEYQIQQSQNDTSAEAITLNDGALVN